MVRTKNGIFAKYITIFEILPYDTVCCLARGDSKNVIFDKKRRFILIFSSALDMHIPDPHEFTGKALALLLNTAPPNSSFAKLSAHSASYNKTLDRKYLNQ